MRNFKFALVMLFAFLASTAIAASKDNSSIKKEIVLNERFEAESNFFANAKFSTYSGKLYFGEQAIAGKASLELNNLNENGEFPMMLTYPASGGLETGKAYRISFDYKALSDSLRGGKLGYICVDGVIDGQLKRIDTRDYSSTKGSYGSINFNVVVSDSYKNVRLTFTSNKGAHVLIDNFRIEAFSFPKEATWILQKESFIGIRKTPMTDGYFDAKLGFHNIPKDKFYPFIDKYGQFKHRNWKGKIKKDSDIAKRTEAEADFEESLQPLNRDEFGGFISDKYKFEATGRFYVKKVEGKWYFISPKGNLFWSQGVDGVGEFNLTPISGREFYFDDVADKKYIRKEWWGMFDYAGRAYDAFSFMERNMDIKYGTSKLKDYKKITDRRFKKWGLNTYGAWTSLDILETPQVPYALIGASNMAKKLKSKKKLVEYWREFPDFFDAEFEAGTMKNMQSIKKFIDSPYCLGVFVDNEMPWQWDTLMTPKAVLYSSETQPMKIAFRDFLKEKYKEIAYLNKVWNAPYKNWDDFLLTSDFEPKTKESEVDLLAFERKIYEKYFSVCRAAVKAASPKALFFGCRLAWTNPLVAQVASEYCDVVSYNHYNNNVAGFKHPEGCKDKPIIIGEYHFGDQSRGVFGGGLRPRKNGREQAKSYIEYTESAIENPLIVGAHWFQWFDQPTTGRFDGENYAVGLVDICDTPNYSLVKAVYDVASRLYELRTTSEKESREANTEKATTY